MARASTVDPGRGARSKRAGSTKGNTRASTRGGKAGSKGGGFIKLMKLLVLMSGAALTGFVVVFALDTGAGAVGKVRFGDTTVASLVDKVVDRVLDRDVPRKDVDDERPKARAKPLPTPVAKAPVRDRQKDKEKEERTTARAELPAPRPDDYAKRSKPHDAMASSDPQVERAKRRLDDLIDRL